MDENAEDNKTGASPTYGGGGVSSAAAASSLHLRKRSAGGGAGAGDGRSSSFDVVTTEKRNAMARQLRDGDRRQRRDMAEIRRATAASGGYMNKIRLAGFLALVAVAAVAFLLVDGGGDGGTGARGSIARRWLKRTTMRITGRKPQQQQNDGEDQEEEDKLPPVQRHIVTLFPIEAGSIRHKLRPFFGRYSIATPENARARHALREFHNVKKPLVAGNAPNRRGDKVALYAWEKSDFDSQLRSMQLQQLSASKQSNSTYDEDEVCIKGFDKAYRTTFQRHLDPIKEDLIMWCLMKDRAHDGYVKWDVRYPPSPSSTATPEKKKRRRRTVKAPSNALGLLGLQPAYKGLAVKYHNEQRIQSTSLLLQPMTLLQGDEPEEEVVAGDGGRNATTNSTAAERADFARDVLEFIVKGEAWLPVRDKQRAIDAHKRSLDEFLYQRIVADVPPTPDSTNTSDKEGHQWVFLQAVCRSRTTPDAGTGEEEEDDRAFQRQLEELDATYRRVAATGCSSAEDRDENTAGGEGGDCDCVLYHPDLKPLPKLARRDDDDDD